MDKRSFKPLIKFLSKVPAIKKGIGFGIDEKGFWWVKFQIDVKNKLAWNVVQELGCIVNYISINERLPTIFYPVSPAPYLNGGPQDFLSWVIETKDKNFKPLLLKKWLESRMPDPVDDVKSWKL